MPAQNLLQPFPIDLAGFEKLPCSFSAAWAAGLEREGDQVFRPNNTDPHIFVVQQSRVSDGFRY